MEKMRIDTSKYTKEQVEAIIDSRIADYSEYCGGLEEDYELTYKVEKNSLGWFITFDYVTEVIYGKYDSSTNSYDTDCKTSEVQITWLIGGNLINLFESISNVLDTVTKHKVEEVYK